MSIDEETVKELLRIKGEYLYHREGQEIEFKEQFNFNGLDEYLRDFAAFANNRGGFLIFGVMDSPRIPLGLNKSSLEQFNKIDPARISGFLLDIFSPNILWDQAIVNLNGKSFGVFQVYQADSKPVIAKKDEGREQTIRNGEIYYRYGGRTQRIRYAELETIIAYRIDQINRQWRDLVQKIGDAGPQNAAILDTKNAIIKKEDAQILVMDKELVQKLRFIQEGKFSEGLYNELGKTTLSMPSLLELPDKELDELADGFTQQAIKTKDLKDFLILTEKEKNKFIQTRPVSLFECKEKIHAALVNKSKKNDVFEETEFDPAYHISDPELVQAARLGKHALRDQKIMRLLWDKFKSQSKIAQFLGVNRSSVNRRCKEFNLI